MQRRSQLLTILICSIASLAMANAAIAQFADANWKRWDWSVLYPGDETSSTVARFLSVDGSTEKCSVGLLAAEKEAAAEDFSVSSLVSFGKCQVHSVATQFSRGTRWCHLQLLGISREFRATFEGWGAELKSQAELICCVKEALVASESQRRADEYWSYYEDRTHWLRSAEAAGLSRKTDSHSDELAKSCSLDESFEYVLSSLSRVPGEQVSAAGNQVSRLFDRTALRVLEWNEQLVGSSRWLQSSRKKMNQTFRLASAVLNRGKKQADRNRAWLGQQTIQCCEKFAIATMLETRRAVVGIETAVNELVQGSVSILALLPVEAIGHVFAD